MRLRREEGLSTLELGIVLPVLLVILAVIVPVIQAGWTYMSLSRAAAAGARYASRVDENAHVGPGGGLTRRPTAEEVRAFVQDAASPIGAVTVTTLIGDVAGDPSGALPGEVITVEASTEVTFGPLATLANQIKSAFFPPGPGAFLPASRTVTVSHSGREE